MLTRFGRFDPCHGLWRGALILLLSIGWVGTQAQSTPERCSVAGAVTSGGAPLPGVAITATSAEGRDVAATATEPTGVYEIRVPGPGSYGIRAELSAFAPITRQVTLTAEACTTRLDLPLVLASRAPAVPPTSSSASPGAPGQPAAAPPAVQAVPTQNASAGRGRGSVAGAGNGRGRGGFQQLAVVESATGAEASAQTTEESVDALRSQLQLPPGFSADAPTETVATTGNQGQLNEALLFGGRGGREGGPDGFDRFGENGFGDAGGQQAGSGGAGGGRGGGPGGFGGGGGGFGGPGGAFGGLRGGGGRLQGSATYSLGGSFFDAAPYSLRGQPVDQPDYTQQRYGVTVGGPLKIPHIFNGGTRTSFFFNYAGNRSRNPVDSYSTVPTLAERAGDFSAEPAQVFDPTTGQPFSGNVIPSDRLSSASLTLLPFLPEPNLPGDTQNFHFLTALTSASDDVNVRLTHVFGADLPQRGGRGGFQPGGGRGGFGGRGGPGGPGGRGPSRPRSVLNVNVSYHHTSAAQSSAFPTVGGTTTGDAWNVPVTYMYAHGPFNNLFTADYNRSSAEATNLYAFSNNIVGAAGIQGVSTDPFDWGLPSLSFTTIADIRDRIPSRLVNQRVQLTDTMTRTFGKHTVRVGGDFRALRIDSLTNTNPRGSFVFTGLYTSSIVNGRVVPGTGFDFADFLLGLSQQASVQYGPGEIRLSGHTVSGFAQDDWRVRGNLTINYGLRYEYVSPFVEADNRLVNLDVPSDFTAAVPVEAGQTGPFTGAFPLSLVEPDRNNFGPRVGIAWKPDPKITIRTGYGINYNLGVYGTIAQKLAGQPPFAVTATTLGGVETPLPIVDAFAGISSSTTTNSYGIDRFFQLGEAQIWNVDVQRDLPKNLTVNVGYTGTHGSDLDIQRAPNRDPDGGVRIPDVQPFLWESSEGHSTLHTVTVRVRKRLARGMSFGGAYAWAHAFDNASSIGGGGATVAQNDQDLAAEWGRSTFERRHTLNADYLIELPWGKGRHWLDNNGTMSQIFGGWSWSGNLTAQSGSPFTARVVGNFLDVSNGVNGTLRADYNGQPISIADPTVQRFFNTDAFSIPPPGLFGTAARNTIIGPGYANVNMALSKNFNFSRSRGMTVRIQASNVFNNVEFSTIDTVVNSPTFGEVIGVRPMRSIQLLMRVRF